MPLQQGAGKKIRHVEGVTRHVAGTNHARPVCGFDTDPREICPQCAVDDFQHFNRRTLRVELWHQLRQGVQSLHAVVNNLASFFFHYLFAGH